METVKIINATPLELFAAVDLSRLTRFVPVERASERAGDGSSYFRVRHMAEAALKPAFKKIRCTPGLITILDSDSVADGWEDLPGRAGAPALVLKLYNNTDRYVDVFRVGTAELKARLRPGARQDIPGVYPGETWRFYSTTFHELMGMAIVGLDPKAGRENLAIAVEVTNNYLNEWRAYQAQSTSTSSPENRFTPLRVIGERRGSTPPHDDVAFINASVVDKDVSEGTFNGRKNRIVRDIEIAGVTLRWAGSNRLDGSKSRLADFYGKDKSDMRSVTIYADRMEVVDELWFPGSNVTIYARQLVFEGNGHIKTTPLPYEDRAKSEYLTKDPEDPTNANMPADKDGNPTYIAKDGANGEPGGDITLYVGEVIDTPGNTRVERFICTGGQGQKGEAGGPKKYTYKEGYPARFQTSKAVTTAMIEEFVPMEEDKTGGWRADYYRWPGEVDWPWKMQIPEFHQNQVALVTLELREPAYPSVRLWGYLPAEDKHWKRNEYNYKHEGDPDNDPHPGPLPCKGRDAYPGGWPGDGGKGGNIKLGILGLNVSDATCNVKPGPPGEKTDPTKGSLPPGLDKWTANTLADQRKCYHLKITAVFNGRSRLNADPSYTPIPIPLEPGASAKGRGFGKPDSDYEVKESKASSGTIVRPAPDSKASWMHPRVVGAVLSYARTAYRNGFRDDAAAAIDPYYAMASPTADGELRILLGSITAMRNNLVRNLDYYGNPPGWIPRLQALNNLQILTSVRKSAYETYYFADKLLKQYETLDNARAMSLRTSEALKKELETAKDTLRTAYDQIPKSRDALMKIQADLGPIQQDIKHLRDLAFDRTKDPLLKQRFYSGAMQILGGIAKSLPVGQPFTGVVGSAFGAASQVDWNAEDPLKTARKAIDDFGGDVTKFVKDNKDQVAELLSKAGPDKEDQVTRATRALEDEENSQKENAPGKVTENLEKDWTAFKKEERDTVEAQIAAAERLITQIDAIIQKKLEQIAAADTDDKKAKLNSEKAEEEAERTRAGQLVEKLKADVRELNEKKFNRLSEVVEYRKKQMELEAEARELEKSKKPELQAAAAKIKARAEKLEGLKNNLTKAKREREDEKTKVEARKKATADVMTSLEKLGEGLGNIGNGIVTLATPLTPEDPTWKRLAEQLLVNDPELRQRGKALDERLQETLVNRSRAAEALSALHQLTSTCISTITTNLGALSALSAQRQSIGRALDPSVKGYLQETKDRAKDILNQSIYWFVKSYQYEFLSDVDDTFYTFDSQFDKLIVQAEEANKLKARAAAAGVNAAGADVGRDETDIVLTEAEFQDIGDKVFKAETLRLGGKLLAKRQERGQRVAGNYTSCVFERSAPKPGDKDAENRLLVNKKLDQLLARGEISFHFIDDFAKGSFEKNNARVVDVKLTGLVLDLDTTGRNLTLTCRIVHSGRSVISSVEKGERIFSVFQCGRNDAPVYWQFTYNQSLEEKDRLAPATKVGGLDEAVKALIDPTLKEFQDYSPGLFSDYTLMIQELTGPDAPARRAVIRSINKVVMDVAISED